jgi:gas vesicle protein
LKNYIVTINKNINFLKLTIMSNFGKDLLVFVGGAAIGALVGILYAPAKGAATRRKLASTTRDLRNTMVDKLEDLVESAEDLVDELKDNATDFLCSNKRDEATEEKK